MARTMAIIRPMRLRLISNLAPSRTGKRGFLQGLSLVRSMTLMCLIAMTSFYSFVSASSLRTPGPGSSVGTAYEPLPNHHVTTAPTGELEVENYTRGPLLLLYEDLPVAQLLQQTPPPLAGQGRSQTPAPGALLQPTPVVSTPPRDDLTRPPTPPVPTLAQDILTRQPTPPATPPGRSRSTPGTLTALLNPQRARRAAAATSQRGHLSPLLEPRDVSGAIAESGAGKSTSDDASFSRRESSGVGEIFEHGRLMMSSTRSPWIWKAGFGRNNSSQSSAQSAVDGLTRDFASETKPSKQGAPTVGEWQSVHSNRHEMLTRDAMQVGISEEQLKHQDGNNRAGINREELIKPYDKKFGGTDDAYVIPEITELISMFLQKNLPSKIVQAAVPSKSVNREMGRVDLGVNELSYLESYSENNSNASMTIIKVNNSIESGAKSHKEKSFNNSEQNTQLQFETKQNLTSEPNDKMDVLSDLIDQTWTQYVTKSNAWITIDTSSIIIPLEFQNSEAHDFNMGLHPSIQKAIAVVANESQATERIYNANEKYLSNLQNDEKPKADPVYGSAPLPLVHSFDNNHFNKADNATERDSELFNTPIEEVSKQVNKTIETPQASIYDSNLSPNPAKNANARSEYFSRTSTEPFSHGETETRSIDNEHESFFGYDFNLHSANDAQSFSKPSEIEHYIASPREVEAFPEHRKPSAVEESASRYVNQRTTNTELDKLSKSEIWHEPQNQTTDANPMKEMVNGSVSTQSNLSSLAPIDPIGSVTIYTNAPLSNAFDTNNSEAIKQTVNKFRDHAVWDSNQPDVQGQWSDILHSSPHPAILQPSLVNVGTISSHSAIGQPNLIVAKPNLAIREIAVPQPNFVIPQQDLAVLQPTPVLTLPSFEIQNQYPAIFQPNASFPSQDSDSPLSDFAIPQPDLAVPQPNPSALQPNLAAPQPNLVVPSNLAVSQPNQVVVKQNFAVPSNLEVTPSNFVVPQPNLTVAQINLANPGQYPTISHQKHADVPTTSAYPPISQPNLSIFQPNFAISNQDFATHKPNSVDIATFSSHSAIPQPDIAIYNQYPAISLPNPAILNLHPAISQLDFDLSQPKNYMTTKVKDLNEFKSDSETAYQVRSHGLSTLVSQTSKSSSPNIRIVPINAWNVEWTTKTGEMENSPTKSNSFETNSYTTVNRDRLANVKGVWETWDALLLASTGENSNENSPTSAPTYYATQEADSHFTSASATSLYQLENVLIYQGFLCFMTNWIHANL